MAAVAACADADRAKQDAATHSPSRVPDAGKNATDAAPQVDAGFSRPPVPADAGPYLSVCVEQQRDVLNFVRDNKACQSDADCTVACTSCNEAQEGCSVFYMNRTYDQAEWARLDDAAWGCIAPDDGLVCAWCGAEPWAPACQNGRCVGAEEAGACGDDGGASEDCGPICGPPGDEDASF